MHGFGFGFLRSRSSAAPSPFATLSWSALDPRLSFARASPASYYDPATGLIAYAEAGEPRFEAAGMLVEEPRTNRITHPSEFDNAVWPKPSGTGVTANQAVAPDGTLTADLVYNLLAATGDRLRSPIAADLAGSSHMSASMFLRATETSLGDTARLRGKRDPPGGGDFTSVDTDVELSDVWKWSSGSWQLAANNTSACLSIHNLAAHTADTLFGWGAGLEVGAFATSHIPTAASTVTRSADACVTTDSKFTDWLALPERTVTLKASSPASGIRTIYYECKTGDHANHHVWVYTDDADIYLEIVAGGATQVDVAIGSATASRWGGAHNPFKLALALSADGEMHVSVDGAAAVTDSGLTMPECDAIWFGCDPDGHELCGHLDRSEPWRFLASLGDVEVLAA